MSRQWAKAQQWVTVAMIGLAVFVIGLSAAAQTRPKPVEATTQELKIAPATVAQNGEQLQLLVELKAPAAAEVFQQMMASATGASTATATAHAFAAAQAEFHAIESAQQQVATALAAPAIRATEIFRVKRAMNAISVYATRDKLAEIKALPGVKAVYIVQPEYPTNSTSVPFIGAPQVWTDTLGLGKNLTGAGVKIGIIDTGIDYIHANFGGDGLAWISTVRKLANVRG